MTKNAWLVAGFADYEEMEMKPEEREQARGISELIYCNPFLPGRIGREREILGDRFVERGADWNLGSEWREENENIANLRRIAERLAGQFRSGFGGRRPAGREEAELYEGVVFFYLFHRFCPAFDRLIEAGLRVGDRRERVEVFGEFREEVERWLMFGGKMLREDHRAELLFAFFFQLRRAFFQIFRHLAGRSPAMAELRAAIWESIFTHDMRRFRRALYDRMGEMATLITGPTGTGKELVARAIGFSRFIPFDVRSQRFVSEFAGGFYPLNPAALSPALIESELFGHRRGAFTGAMQDRAGWLEVCGESGTVFLDEIGEVDPAVQVKLLRVLQERSFQRIGETETRRFGGKIIAATNRDLAAEMEAGNFREDFYYRLCSDMIRTPSLAEQLKDSPEELEHLVGFVGARVVGAEEAKVFSVEAVDWIRANLGLDYRWPGNFRELEQCLRNLAIRGEYVPPRVKGNREGDRLELLIEEGGLSAEELMQEYCGIVYDRCRNYEEVARRLKIDRRTVRKYVLGREGKGDLAG